MKNRGIESTSSWKFRLSHGRRLKRTESYDELTDGYGVWWVGGKRLFPLDSTKIKQKLVCN